MQILDPRRKNLLLIDDDQDIRDLLKMILESEGYQVQTAQNGEEGLVKLNACIPAMVLVDFMMPVMNGEVFIETLRAHPAFHQIPVVMISASATRSNAIEAHELLAKPFTLDDLLSVVTDYTGSCCDVVISEP